MTMTYDLKKKSLPYGQALNFIFYHFEILLTGTDRTSYPKLIKIYNRTLIKMKCMLNIHGAWVCKDQMSA